MTLDSRRSQIGTIAAIGNVTDVNCWSGIPYHFWRAALRNGWKADAIQLPLEKAKWRRRLWNAKELLCTRGTGGYQYSEAFAVWARQFVPDPQAGRDLLSFHPFFPSLSRLRERGCRFFLYFDTTHPLMFSRYGLRKNVSPGMERHILETERRVFAEAEQLVFFQRWAAESAVRECGAQTDKVSVILPGANLKPDSSFCFRDSEIESGGERHFSFGFIGKDWRRKGFPKLLTTVELLNRMGIRVTLQCIGMIPEGACRHPFVNYHGFLDKRLAQQQIIDVLASCDLGCLLSDVNASSIAILEYLRVGVPVLATLVDGMGDLIPPDAGFRIPASDEPEAIAEKLSISLKDPETMKRLRLNAQQWSSHVTWDRCLREWDELLQTGRVSHPVRPWLGLGSVV